MADLNEKQSLLGKSEALIDAAIIFAGLRGPGVELIEDIRMLSSRHAKAVNVTAVRI
jgi:hypothetical protein